MLRHCDAAAACAKMWLLLTTYLLRSLLRLQVSVLSIRLRRYLQVVAEPFHLLQSNLINDFSLFCRSSFCPPRGRPQPDRMPRALTERLSRTGRHSASGSKQRRQLRPPPPPPVAGITHSRASRRCVRRWPWPTHSVRTPTP